MYKGIPYPSPCVEAPSPQSLGPKRWWVATLPRYHIMVQMHDLEKEKTMTMTKIPSRKACGTYGHGPLKICPGKEKDDDHDQDSLKKDLLHIWSWSSDKSFSD